MPTEHSNSMRAKIILILALVVIGGGVALLVHMMDEQQDSPRPETPTRYLAPSDSKQNPPAPFSAPKVQENELLP